MSFARLLVRRDMPGYCGEMEHTKSTLPLLLMPTSATSGFQWNEKLATASVRLTAIGSRRLWCTRYSFAATGAEKEKVFSAASCQASPLLASEHPQTLLLCSNVFSCKMQGYAFLPAWAMQALRIKDGEEVSVEALPLPLNKAGRAMQLSSQGSSIHLELGQ